MNEWATAAKGVRVIRSAVTPEQVNMAFDYFMLAFMKIVKNHKKKCLGFNSLINMFDDFDEVSAEIVDLANNKQKLLAQKGG
jgi:hypothetical protein